MLSARSSVWSRVAFEQWWEEEGRHAIHLDLHRTGCRNETAHRFGVNAFRVAPLLSRGALVISHKADPEDVPAATWDSNPRDCQNVASDPLTLGYSSS